MRFTHVFKVVWSCDIGAGGMTRVCVGLDGAQTTPYERLAGSDIEFAARGNAAEEFFPADEFARVLEKDEVSARGGEDKEPPSVHSLPR